MLYKSPYADEIRSLLEVLDIVATLTRKEEMVAKAKSGAEAMKDVAAVLHDVKALVTAQ